MLALTRRVGERVLIGKDIVVVVLKVEGENVRLGFEAPRSMPILREEVDKRNQREGKGAIGDGDVQE